MYVLGAEIEIGGKKFTRVNMVEVESSAKVIEDTATIKMPTTARLERQGKFITEVDTARVFKVGDPVVIRLGYNGELREEFRGFVSKIKPSTPLEIECIDATWTLRRKNLKASFKKTTLKNLLNFILKDTGVSLKGNVPGVNFTEFYFKNVTAATALQKLKDDYGLTVYLKNFNELHVGLSSYTDGMVVKYGISENVIDNDLEWVNEDDTRIKVKAVHIRPNNTKVEKAVGDLDGETRTLFFYDLDDPKQLETMALQELAKYKYSGYKGGFNTFLLPVVQVGNVARIRDIHFEERGGDYLVDKVTTTFGTDGARRKIELGIKVSI
ncbi:MAG: hypothetical protein LCH81_01075 [Bacteroidetes bacterium]|nr:hypothetical protein [Bacteroidota bacterium]